jgi:hypothetical protein
MGTDDHANVVCGAVAMLMQSHRSDWMKHCGKVSADPRMRQRSRQPGQSVWNSTGMSSMRQLAQLQGYGSLDRYKRIDDGASGSFSAGSVDTYELGRKQ